MNIIEIFQNLKKNEIFVEQRQNHEAQIILSSTKYLHDFILVTAITS